MNDETLDRIINKARMLRELHRARSRVRQLERQLSGETVEVQREPEVPAFLQRAHSAVTLSPAAATGLSLASSDSPATLVSTKPRRLFP
jgi:hypothetical protein